MPQGRVTEARPQTDALWPGASMIPVAYRYDNQMKNTGSIREGAKGRRSLRTALSRTIPARAPSQSRFKGDSCPLQVVSGSCLLCQLLGGAGGRVGLALATGESRSQEADNSSAYRVISSLSLTARARRARPEAFARGGNSGMEKA